MTDTLRDQIAAALAGKADDGFSKEDWFFLADAVIEKMDWRKEVESYGMPDSTRYRYVTEWKTGI